MHHFILIALVALPAPAHAQNKHFITAGGGKPYGGKLAAVAAVSIDIEAATSNDFAAFAAEIAARNACSSAGHAYLPAHAQADGQGCVDPAIWGGCGSVGQATAGGICITVGPGALVAAPSDAPTTLEWGGGVGFGSTSATDGEANTATISAAAGSYPAADYCAALNAGGHSDWFLPSRSELATLYANTAVLSGVNAGFYWSSTEDISTNIWLRNLTTGFETGGNQSGNFQNVRCIRRHD